MIILITNFRNIDMRHFGFKLQNCTVVIVVVLVRNENMPARKFNRVK